MSTTENQGAAQAQDEYTYTGKPEDVGTQLFMEAIGTTLKDVLKQYGPEKCARMYAGVLAGYSGVMLEDFGPQAVIEILRGTADNLERAVAAGELGVGSA